MSQQYPSIVRDITTDDSRRNLVADGFDAGVHFCEYIQKDMIAVQVSDDYKPAIVAAPEYLQSRTRQKLPKDLVQHRCINFWHGSAGLYRWEFEKGKRSVSVSVTGPLIVEDTDLVLQAALDGVGFAFCLSTRLALTLKQRQPDSGRSAIGGHNRMLAILGTSEKCIATNPSHRNVTLAALEETVHMSSVMGDRQSRWLSYSSCMNRHPSGRRCLSLET